MSAPFRLLIILSFLTAPQGHAEEVQVTKTRPTSVYLDPSAVPANIPDSDGFQVIKTQPVQFDLDPSKAPTTVPESSDFKVTKTRHLEVQIDENAVPVVIDPIPDVEYAGTPELPVAEPMLPPRKVNAETSEWQTKTRKAVTAVDDLNRGSTCDSLYCDSFTLRPTGSNSPQNPTQPERQKATLPYETCNAQNDSFEKLLDADKTEPVATYLAEEADNSPISKCIYFAQKKTSGSFAQCDGHSSTPSRTKTKPCESAHYHALVTNGLSDISSCLKIDSRTLFPLFDIESGFHPTAISSTNAGGVGQFTQGAIQDMNSRRPRYYKQMTSSTESSCQRLSSIIASKMADRPSQRCDVMVPPERTIQNMIYTAMYYLENRKRVRRYIQEAREDHSEFASDPEAYRELVDLLTVLSHNTGAGNVHVLLEGFARSFPHRMTAEETKVELLKNINRHAGRMAGEPTDYLSRMLNKVKAAASNAQVEANQCSNF
jgi:cell division septum initiation protein DivIVA